MSHWAEIDENNKVIRVLVGNNSMPNEGYDWIIDNLGGNWIKTSYNDTYAGIGYTYDKVKNVFIAPEPEGNLGFNEQTGQWIMPVVDLDAD